MWPGYVHEKTNFQKNLTNYRVELPFHAPMWGGQTCSTKLCDMDGSFVCATYLFVLVFFLYSITVIALDIVVSAPQAILANKWPDAGNWWVARCVRLRRKNIAWYRGWVCFRSYQKFGWSNPAVAKSQWSYSKYETVGVDNKLFKERESYFTPLDCVYMELKLSVLESDRTHAMEYIK